MLFSKARNLAASSVKLELNVVVLFSIDVSLKQPRAPHLHLRFEDSPGDFFFINDRNNLSCDMIYDLTQQSHTCMHIAQFAHTTWIEKEERKKKFIEENEKKGI